ncbi:aldo/keto reductase, partial [Priestia aryabhattai]
LYKEREIRTIGVSNFYPDRLVDLILNNEVVPAVNQVENHPFFQQKAAKKVMEEYGVQIQSWGPFAEGQNNIFQNELLSGIGAKYGKTEWHKLFCAGIFNVVSLPFQNLFVKNVSLKTLTSGISR